jgi:hypothetical protein
MAIRPEALELLQHPAGQRVRANAGAGEKQEMADDLMRQPQRLSLVFLIMAI